MKAKITKQDIKNTRLFLSGPVERYPRTDKEIEDYIRTMLLYDEHFLEDMREYRRRDKLVPEFNTFEDK